MYNNSEYATQNSCARNELTHTDTQTYQSALHVEGLHLNGVLRTLQDLGLLSFANFRADGRLERGKAAC